MKNLFQKNETFRASLSASAPVFFGYMGIGIPFGLMIANAGYPVWLAPVMSVSMYAGAGQYTAISLFAIGENLASIALAELLVNIRHLFYGLSLIKKLASLPFFKKTYIIFALTDETYSLLTSVDVPKNKNINETNFYFFIAILNHSYWILGGIIGAVAGSVLPFSFEGVDFALTALFIVLLIEQIKKTREIFPPLAGFVGGALALILMKLHFIQNSNMLLVSLILTFVFLLFSKNENAKNSNGENDE